MKRHRKTLLSAVVPFLVILALMAVLPAFYYNSAQEVYFTVADKERVCSGGEEVECEYLVFTEAETFKNKDSILFRKFDSSDVQGRLRVEETYQATVAGWRIPLFSMYRNIVEVDW